MNVINRSRNAFHCQPAQHLLIDVGHPMTLEILKCVIDAAENVMSLACSLYGGVRIPEFGMSLINKDFCNVLQILQVRGNYPKIAKSFKFVPELVKHNEKNSFQEFSDNLKLAIQKVLEGFTSQQNQTCLREKLSSQFVVITLITMRDGSQIQNYLEEVLNYLSIEKLKKICILQIVESTKSVTKMGTLVDYTQIELSTFKMEQFYKQWLLDCDTSQEHVCIHINSNDRKESNITIKCDIVDSMINPFLLPFGHFYQVQTDYFKGSGVIKFPAKYVPVYNLIVTNRISGSGLCESLLFGQPQRLSPTKCWRMEGNDSLINQQYFYSLCKQLLDNNEYLLALSTHSEDGIKVPAHFILIPGTHTLLLRAVTPSELVLPKRKVEVLQTDTTLSQRIADNVNFAFIKLPIINDFMPDTVSSNLYHILKGNLTQKIEVQEEPVERNINVDHPALDTQRTKLCLNKKRRLL